MPYGVIDGEREHGKRTVDTAEFIAGPVRLRQESQRRDRANSLIRGDNQKIIGLYEWKGYCIGISNGDDDEAEAKSPQVLQCTLTSSESL